MRSYMVFYEYLGDFIIIDASYYEIKRGVLTFFKRDAGIPGVSYRKFRSFKHWAEVQEMNNARTAGN